MLINLCKYSSQKIGILLFTSNQLKRERMQNKELGENLRSRPSRV